MNATLYILLTLMAVVAVSGERMTLRDVGSCLCSDFTWFRVLPGRRSVLVGDCRARDAADGLFFCYVHQPNDCFDAQDSSTFLGMQVSKEACLSDSTDVNFVGSGRNGGSGRRRQRITEETNHHDDDDVTVLSDDVTLMSIERLSDDVTVEHLSDDVTVEHLSDDVTVEHISDDVTVEHLSDDVTYNNEISDHDLLEEVLVSEEDDRHRHHGSSQDYHISQEEEKEQQEEYIPSVPSHEY